MKITMANHLRIHLSDEEILVVVKSGTKDLYLWFLDTAFQDGNSGQDDKNTIIRKFNLPPTALDGLNNSFVTTYLATERTNEETRHTC